MPLLGNACNCRLCSDLAAIVGAKMIFRVLASGERRGMADLPVVHRAWWTRGLAVNYIASYGKPGDAIAQGGVADPSPSIGKG